MHIRGIVKKPKWLCEGCIVTRAHRNVQRLRQGRHLEKLVSFSQRMTNLDDVPIIDEALWPSGGGVWDLSQLLDVNLSVKNSSDPADLFGSQESGVDESETQNPVFIGTKRARALLRHESLGC